MEVVEKLAGGVTLFRFLHGSNYREAQMMFWEAVESMNPDAFLVRNLNYMPGDR